MRVNIKEKKNKGASFQVTVEAKESETVLATETITAQSVQSLDQQITRFRNMVAQVQTEFDQVNIGEWTEPVEPERVVRTPSPEQEARAKLETAYEELQRRLITDAEYDAVVAEVKDTLKPKDEVTKK